MIMQQLQDLGCAARPYRDHSNLYEEEDVSAAAASAALAAQRMLMSDKPNSLHTHIIPHCAHTDNLHPHCAHTPHKLHPHYTHTHPTSLLPHNVGDFTPLGTLGRGNMGTVILVLSKAHDGRPPFPFALKVTHALSTKKQRSHVERDILSSLHHPFLQTLHAHSEFGLHSLLLLDFCSGGDLNLLRHRQPERRFSETAARFYAAEVLVALEHLHKLGIVYRDLKPENILVQGSGHIKLTDFDLSLKIGAGRRAEEEFVTMPPISSAARAPICSLQQQLVAEAEAVAGADLVQGNQSLHRGGFAGLRKCISTRREGALEGVKGKGCFCETNVEAAEKCLRKMGAGQRFSCGMMCLGGTREGGEVCLSRTKQGAEQDCLSRRRKCLGEKEARKARNATNGDEPRAASRAAPCFPCFKNKVDIDAEERCVCVVGTDEYVAPEVLRGEEHGFSMDWWSFGIFLYEMIYGSTPFKGATSEETLRNILERESEFPGMKTPAKHLIAQLLVKDPAVRLGAIMGAHDIKRHSFFHGLHWESLPHICRPPFIPPPLCFSELEERYSAKLKAKRETQNEQKLSNTYCKSWLDEVVESMEAAENEHQSSQCSRSSSSAGFMSSSADGADRELRRDDDVDALFSSAEWSSELDVCLHPSS